MRSMDGPACFVLRVCERHTGMCQAVSIFNANLQLSRRVARSCQEVVRTAQLTGEEAELNVLLSKRSPDTSALYPRLNHNVGTRGCRNCSRVLQLITNQSPEERSARPTRVDRQRRISRVGERASITRRGLPASQTSDAANDLSVWGSFPGPQKRATP
ncbi:hypothetical protein SKAU_G00028450 [Synaphobranchus kaupii]|uniref:Uncharacterized protein n=1 Tax=Synaphobranchus kaupii TaxID=118154 RepID=A0A9Q1GF34_SYNKA|nr:hypothetical protein SKAU_G00028450 [Synaphobranchus kaupii]